MFIEIADILHSVERLDQSLIRSVTFKPFIDEIFALLCERFTICLYNLSINMLMGVLPLLLLAI